MEGKIKKRYFPGKESISFYYMIIKSIRKTAYRIPCAIIPLATFINPATLAPFT